jgi:hypothetical protein
MRDDCQKLVHAWPGKRPSGAALRKLGKSSRRGGMKRRVLAVRIDENIGVEGDQDWLS